MTRPLTETQQKVLAYLRQFHAEQDQLPPAHAIAAHFGWKSQNAAHEHLQALEAQGHIERNAVNKYRFKREASCTTI